MIKNKKADLSLSINAIVILILAITMLGLGLTFMRGLFKQATEKVESAVNVQQLTNPPTADNPLTVSPAALTVRSTKSDKLLAAFLNTGGERGCALTKSTGIGAAGVDPASGGITLILNTNPATMKTDQINTWTVGVTAGTATGTGLYTLTMTCLTDTYKKDVVITVTS